MEYRLVLVDQSVLPAEIPIRDALTGVFLGADFPKARRPALLAALEPYPEVEVLSLVHHNRSLNAYPIPRSHLAEKVFSITPRRSGTLEDRLVDLQSANDSATRRREQAEVVCAEPVRAIHEAVAAVAGMTALWPQAEAELLRRISAVPEHQRSRRPGVPGEQIHLETGSICVVENLPKYTHTLVAGGALQALGNDRIRIHSMVTLEHWNPNGNERKESWRAVQEVPLAESVAAIERLAMDLKTAVADIRTTFDQARGR